jgi:hypothetical protein
MALSPVIYLVEMDRQKGLMFRNSRVLPARSIAVLTMLVVQLALAVACGGGEESPRNGTSTTSDDSKILSDSILRFDALRSYVARSTTVSTLGDGPATTSEETLKFSSPETDYTETVEEDGTTKTLETAGSLFVNTEPLGWYMVATSSTATNRHSGTPFSDPDLKHSLLDTARYVGQEGADETTYLHYQLELALPSAQDIFSEGCSNGIEFQDPIIVDLWIDSISHLPIRLQWKESLLVDGEVLEVDATAEYSDFDAPVSIPTPPSDVPSLPGFDLDECFPAANQ